MSRTRQSDDESAIVLRTYAATFPSGFVLEPHSHDWAQLVYAERGVMTVEAAGGSWVVPPHRAVWVPHGTTHRIAMSGIVAMRTLYLAQAQAVELPRECRTISVSPLLRELIFEAIRLGMLHRDVPSESSLTRMITDHLATVRAEALELPTPAHPRLRAIAERLQARPELEDNLPAIAAGAHMSVRNFERIFRAETHLTFVQWRRRMRLLHALRLLAAGRGVTEVGFDVGYRSTSAFIAAFKRELGTTPLQYYADDQSGTPQSRR